MSANSTPAPQNGAGKYGEKAQIDKRAAKPAKPGKIVTLERFARAVGTELPWKDFWDYPENDLGAADLFRARHGKDVHFVPGIGWFIWDGSGWRRDEQGKVAHLVAELARECLRESSEIENQVVRETAASRAIKLGKKPAMEAALAVAQSHPAIALLANRLDADPLLLGTPNGVVDLRTGTFREGQRSDLITRRIGVKFDHLATCPRWERFLSEVMKGDAELVEYLQLAVGYSLTASMREQLFFFLHGGGSNGKTVFIETLLALLGEYGAKASETLLTYSPETRRSDPKTELAELPSVRLLLAPEMKEKSHLNEGLVKDITGGDAVRGEAKYKAGFTFNPTCKLWFFGNHKPRIAGVDHGIWRRVRLIPFEATFDEETQDLNLPETLRAELPGILNWAIRGAQEWAKRGRLPMPDKVRLAIADYRTAEDTLGDFIRAHLREEHTRRVKKKDVFERYQKWAEASGNRHPMTAQSLNKALKSRVFYDANGSDYWHGWSLVEEKTDGLDK